jgi:hypothetical protein
LQHQLVGVVVRGWFIEQAVETSAVHEVDAHQPGEGERALDQALSRLCQTQQQKGDQRDGDLDADGVLGGAEEAGDLQGLLDPAEEQLDGPTAAIEIGDFLSAGISGN